MPRPITSSPTSTRRLTAAGLLFPITCSRSPNNGKSGCATFPPAPLGLCKAGPLHDWLVPCPLRSNASRVIASAIADCCLCRWLKEILDFKPAPRLEQVDDKHHKPVQDCKHRSRSCDDSALQRESQ